MALTPYQKLPTDDTGYLLWRLSNIWRKKVNESIAEHKITHVQYLLLASIHQLEMDGKLTSQKQIANHAKVDIMMTSKVLRSLERKKLITRKRYHLDGRVFICKINERGIEKINQVSPIIKKLDIAFFDSVTQNKFSLQSIFAQMIKENYAL